MESPGALFWPASYKDDSDGLYRCSHPIISIQSSDYKKRTVAVSRAVLIGGHSAGANHLNFTWVGTPYAWRKAEFFGKPADLGVLAPRKNSFRFAPEP